MYFEGIIDTFEKLINEIVWDWPDGIYPEGAPKIRKCDNPRHTATQGYAMNKPLSSKKMANIGWNIKKLNTR